MSERTVCHFLVSLFVSFGFECSCRGSRPGLRLEARERKGKRKDGYWSGPTFFRGPPFHLVPYYIGKRKKKKVELGSSCTEVLISSKTPGNGEKEKRDVPERSFFFFLRPSFLAVRGKG